MYQHCIRCLDPCTKPRSPTCPFYVRRKGYYFLLSGNGADSLGRRTAGCARHGVYIFPTTSQACLNIHFMVPVIRHSVFFNTLSFYRHSAPQIWPSVLFHSCPYFTLKTSDPSYVAIALYWDIQTPKASLPGMFFYCRFIPLRDSEQSV